MMRIVSVIIALLLVASIVTVNGIGINVNVNAYATSELRIFLVTDKVHELPLKATQSANGQITQVSTFAITPENVIQVKQNDQL